MPDPIRLRVKMTNGLGLHLRPASRLVQLARQFRSEVRVSCDGRAANGKSILDLMMLGAGCGARLEIEILGPDAEEATAELCALVEQGFREEEGAGPRLA
jgi:phosphotransferase system HPr (HPr) family protein